MRKSSDKKDLQSYWIKEIQAEQKAHRPYRERAKKVYELWLDANPKSSLLGNQKSRFNILYSNTQTIHSVLYSGNPKPNIKRRYLDSDPVARELAEMMERALDYSNDIEGFKSKINGVVDDYLVAALGVVRVRYDVETAKGEPPRIPVYSESQIDDDGLEYNRFFAEERELTSEDVSSDDEGLHTFGDPEEVKEWETVSTEVVPWDRFGWQPAKCWEDVGYCYVIHYLSKEELEGQLGEEESSGVPLGYSATGDKLETSEAAKGTHALVYELFDKITRRVITIAEGMREVIGVEDDPLEIENFYPFPKPVFANVGNADLLPVPDYVYYQDQAREMDVLTQRIDKLTDALRYRGIYDASFPSLSQLSKLADNQFIPIDDFAKFEKSNIDSVMKELPIDGIAKVLTVLHDQRDRCKQTIYEITGISDIVRGASVASETLGAQQIKQKFAGLRIQSRQQVIEEFIRDIFRIKIEIIVEHFDAEVLSKMTGIQVTPEMQSIMKDDLMRCYSISVETDSTVAEDSNEEQKNRAEILSAITTFIQAIAPAVQGGYIPIEAAKEMLIFGIRGFKGARNLETILEQIGQQAGNAGGELRPESIPPGIGGGDTGNGIPAGFQGANGSPGLENNSGGGMAQLLTG